MITPEQEVKIREKVREILAKDIDNEAKEVEIAKAITDEMAEKEA